MKLLKELRELGGKSLGTLAEFTRHARLNENRGGYPRAQSMPSDLLNDQETVIGNIRKGVDATDEKYKDMVTNNFLTGLMEKHEKMAWMLRAHIEGKD